MREWGVGSAFALIFLSRFALIRLAVGAELTRVRELGPAAR